MGRLWELSEPLERGWRSRSACRRRPELPWTNNIRPREWELGEMNAICQVCPVLRKCGEFALEQRGVGGFWASVWIPWPTQGGNDLKVARERARAMLRRKVAESPLTEKEA